MRYSSFQQVTTETIANIIGNVHSKSCELDPLPISIVNAFTPELPPALTKLAIHPSSLEIFRHIEIGIPKTLLKKIGLSVIFKNFRPISSLSCLSKLIEHVVSQELIEFIKESRIVEPLQSAYRSQHSTETSLLKVKADILHVMDNQKVTCLIMLDLSVVFDTVCTGCYLTG